MKTLKFIVPAIAIVAIAPAFAVYHASAKHAKATEPEHLTLAKELVQGILDQAAANEFNDANGVLTNRYGGEVGTYYITFADPDVPNSSYSNYTRCAPFLTQLFKEAYNWTPPQAMGNSPDPKKYHNAISKSINGFTFRPDFSKWEPGDILASPYYDTTKNIGHVMLLLSAEEISNDPATKTKEYYAWVLDSSGDLHSSDTRTLYASLNKGGVGMGQIRIKTINNVISQWAWNKTTAYYSADGRPMTIGTINQ
jgi:hypothetical protein